MKSQYHLEITRKALAPYFSEEALQSILRANIGQDKIINQFGHPYFHFDSNSFVEGFAYIDAQEQLVVEFIIQENFRQARQALGRITHTWQDFYSHSNYITLWISDHPDSGPEDIDPADPVYLDHPNLISGNVYSLDFLALVPGLTKLITPLMPEDSHAKMNLDSPASGPLFLYNYQAGLKRTHLEYERIITLCRDNHISDLRMSQFLDKSQEEEKV